MSNTKPKADTKKDKKAKDAAPSVKIKAEGFEEDIVLEFDTQKKKKKKHPWRNLFIKILVIAAIIFAASFFVHIKFIHDNDMFPALRDGDLIITTNLMNYSFNDIILYEVTNDDGTKEFHTGRIMCLEDNDVELSESGDFLVNGSIIMTNDFYETFEKGDIEYPYHIPDNHIFVLQDYRPEVHDSRIYGAISKDAIIGKIIFVFRVRGF